MLAWMTYVSFVSLLLGAAALAAEHRARLRRSASRWFWLLAIVASLLVPTTIASVSVQLPEVFLPEVAQKVITLREVTSGRISPGSWIGGAEAQALERVGMDLFVERAWGVVSILMLLALIVSGAHLFLRKRQWACGTVAGTSVYIATGVGPAVVGLLRPRIVVPTWLTQALPAQQRAVLAHEQSHLDAGDQKLLTVALCLLVFMPWNLPLWWQLQRLRRAIEIDCDARVLKEGHDAVSYGETLLAVGQRQCGYLGAVAAMSESKSFLERRIEIMVRKPAKWWRAAAAALGILSIGLVAAAAAVSPPNAEEMGTGEPEHVVLDSKLIDGYVGSYRIAENRVLTATREGNRMFAQFTGQPRVEVFARNETEFFAKGEKTRGTVIRDDLGHASAVVLHQKGQVDVTAPRIDEALARQINDAAAAKVRSQRATPGSEAALRRLLAQLESDPPDLTGIAPPLAKLIGEQHGKVHPRLAAHGAVKSLEFVGVTDNGMDKYLVRFENGSAQWAILAGADNIITGAWVSE